MAMKIRCSECRKKISIDEAFAGGMCRCPYCKALVYVPEKSGGLTSRPRPAAPGVRPEAPVSRPAAPVSRPAAPSMAPAPPPAPGAAPPPPPPGWPAQGPAGAAAAAAPPPPPGAATEAEHIPMARPVKIQGIITVILLALLVLMVGGGVTAALLWIPSGTGNRDIPDNTTQVNPLTVSRSGPAIADVKIVAAPVIYCLDGGSSMRDTFNGAMVMIANSAVSLGAKMKFTVVLCGETEDKFMSADYTDAGEKGKSAVVTFLEGTAPSGATDLPRALEAALARKPKTIILVARKVVDNAFKIAEEAKSQGVLIHTIAVDGDSEVNESMKKLAKITGGESRSYFSGEF